jgi:8-oxo-dGTP diphosphatase
MPEMKEHSQTIGPKRGVIGIVQRDESFLVIRRSRFVTAPMKLCLPGGTIEPGEAEEQTLVRELQEELNINVSPGRCCFRSRTPWGTLLAWWTAHLDREATPFANPDEVDSWSWMTIDEITQVRDALPSLPEFFEAVRVGKVTL